MSEIEVTKAEKKKIIPISKLAEYIKKVGISKMKRKITTYNPCASQYSRAVSHRNGARRYKNEEDKDYHHIDKKDLEMLRKIWKNEK